MGRKTVCERKRCCVTCGALVTRPNHEYHKRFCETCKLNKDLGHQCYMQPLKDELPPSDGVLYVFYNFETTQNTRYSHDATLHVPNLVCMQQFCSQCEVVEADDC
jgi:hypothetical protein